MKFFVVIWCLSVVLLVETEGHGYLSDPPGRSSRWRTNSSAPVNYDDNALYCGGFNTQYYTYGGKCGICGDSYGDSKPRPNELGGRYGEGVIVKTYANQPSINMTSLITANHKGYLTVALCNLDKERAETEECFKPLKMVDGSDKQFIGAATGKIVSSVVLPKDVVCERCVIRWTYTAGNNWGWCDNGTGALGCGFQETFKSCSDIRIISSRSKLLNVLKESNDEPEIPIIV